MGIDLIPKNTDKISTSPILQQTSLWARMKLIQGMQPRAFHVQTGEGANISRSYNNGKDRYINDDLLVIIKRVGAGARIAYVPYGPVFKPEEQSMGRCLENLAESMKGMLPTDCLAIRFDLPWKSVWTDDENRFDDEGNYLGPPEVRTQEFKMNFETEKWNLFRAPTNVLPTNTIMLNIGKTDDDLLQSMKPKTRYNIRLSARKGVTVRDMGEDALPVWQQLCTETSIRNKIIMDDTNYFKAVLRSGNGSFKSSEGVKLLLAERDRVPLAAIFLAVSANRATYLYGASSSLHRNLMGTYAVQWEAIKTARAAGCTEYDMFGISGSPDPYHPMYGLYRFKTGFGGNIIRREGCWDYPLDHEKYEAFRIAEAKSQGYHL